MATQSKERDPTVAPFWWPDAQGFTIAAILGICATAMFYRMTHPSPVDDKVLDMMLTILFGTALVAIINFLFGSSRSSAAKDQALMQQATAPAVPPTPTVTTTTTDDKTVTKTEPTKP